MYGPPFVCTLRLLKITTLIVEGAPRTPTLSNSIPTVAINRLVCAPPCVWAAACALLESCFVMGVLGLAPASSVASCSVGRVGSAHTRGSVQKAVHTQCGLWPLPKTFYLRGGVARGG